MYNYNLKSMSCVVCLGLGFSSVLESGYACFVFCHERMVGVHHSFMCSCVVFCLSTGPLTSFHWPCATVMFIVLSSLVHFVEHMACGFLRVTIAN